MTPSNYCILFFLLACLSCNTPKKAIHTSKVSSSYFQSDFTKENELFFRAEKERLIGNSKTALQLYTEFAAKYPKYATAHYNLGKLQLLRNDLMNAEKNAEKAVKLDPENKYYQEFYTQLLVYGNKYKLAETQLDLLIKKYPKEEEYGFKKAMLCLKNKQYEQALFCFERLEKSFGFNEDIALQKKNIYLNLEKVDSAIFEINKLKALYPYDVQYPIMIADIYQSEGDGMQVKKMYAQIELNYMHEPMALVALAQYYLQQNNTSKYQAYVKLAMQNQNVDIDNKLALLMPFMQKNDLDTNHAETKVMLEMAKNITIEAPENKNALAFYADFLYAVKNYQEAAYQYNNYLKIDSSSMPIWENLLSVYAEMQNQDSILIVAKKCARLFPKNALPYFYLGFAYIQRKEPTMAIVPLQKAIQYIDNNEPLLAQLYSTLGDAFYTLKNYAASDSNFDAALKLNPNDASTLNNYAYYLSLRKEKLDVAMQMSKKSLTLQPQSKSYLDTYGWVLFQQGKYTDAKSYIEDAIHAGGEDDGALYEHLGDVYYKLNEKDKAIDLWQKAKSKGEMNEILLKKIKNKTIYD